MESAFRTGCKLAVVDATGKVLDTTVVHPTAPTTEKKIRAAKDTVEGMIEKYEYPYFRRKRYHVVNLSR